MLTFDIPATDEKWITVLIVRIFALTVIQVKVLPHLRLASVSIYLIDGVIYDLPELVVKYLLSFLTKCKKKLTVSILHKVLIPSMAIFNTRGPKVRRYGEMGNKLNLFDKLFYIFTSCKKYTVNRHPIQLALHHCDATIS